MKQMKMYLVFVWLKGWGNDRYLVEAKDEEDAKRVALQRCNEENDYTGWEVTEVVERKY